MPGSQGFRGIAGEPYVYQENSAGDSAALGIDISGVYSISASGTAGTSPSPSSQIVIDPLGNTTVRSSSKVVLDAFTQITSLGAGYVKSDSNGNLTIGIPESVIPYTSINHAASPYTALTTDYYISADVTAGVITIRLPNAPTTGTVFIVKDKVGLATTSNISVTTAGGAVLIDGVTTFVMNTAYEVCQFVFNSVGYEIF